MTSNQIAYASQQEDARHNKASEEEIGRHNQATERIDTQLAQIQERRVNVEESHNKEIERIQEEYNTAYISLQTAQGSRKLDIEEQLALIQDRKQAAEQQYQTTMANLRGEEIAWQKDAQIENARHNKAMENQSSQRIMLDQQRLRFDKYAFDTSDSRRAEELRIQWDSNAINRMHTEYDYRIRSEANYVNVLNQRLREAMFGFERDIKWPEEQKLLQAQTINQTISPITNTIGSVLKLIP